MPLGDIRQPIEQLFVTFPLTVNTVPTPLNPSQDINSYIQSFFVCNPSFNANSVFWGDNQVSASSAGPTIGSGIEIVAGTTQSFVISEERQFYEIQDSLNDILTMLVSQATQCNVQSNIMKIPVIVWNPANFYLVAAATTTVSVAIMRSVYI